MKYFVRDWVVLRACQKFVLRPCWLNTLHLRYRCQSQRSLSKSSFSRDYDLLIFVSLFLVCNLPYFTRSSLNIMRFFGWSIINFTSTTRLVMSRPDLIFISKYSHYELGSPHQDAVLLCSLFVILSFLSCEIGYANRRSFKVISLCLPCFHKSRNFLMIAGVLSYTKCAHGRQHHTPASFPRMAR